MNEPDIARPGTGCKLAGVSETLLIPLWARAAETRGPDPIIQDLMAVGIVEKIDYDFDKFNSAWKSRVGVSIRTMILDRAVEKFITRRPGARIINIGAGLDTRFFRVDNGLVRWYDLDLPEVIELRKQFIAESDRVRMIPKSVLDFSWIDDIQPGPEPVLIIAEGLLMYFQEPEVRTILDRLCSAFPGSEMLLEKISPTMIALSKRHDSINHTKARFTWGIYNGREVESFNPGIRFLDEWNYFDFHRERWRWMRWASLFPGFKKRFNTSIVWLCFRQEV